MKIYRNNSIKIKRINKCRFLIIFVLSVFFLSSCKYVSSNRESDYKCNISVSEDLVSEEIEDKSESDSNGPSLESSFQIDYIDVGQADASLIMCDGNYMLIDGGNVDDSDLMYSYLSSRLINNLDVIVCTHAHEDHVGGLSGALQYASSKVVFAPTTDYNSEAFLNFKKALSLHNLLITVPKSGDSFKLGSADVYIIGPVKEYNNVNNTSIVIKVVYGNTSFLFTGDAENESENDILECGKDVKATVLKVGHHGSDSSTSYRWLRSVDAQYAVISCGKNNIYGHPGKNTLSKLRDAEVQVFRTDLQGDIICISDGNNVTFKTSRNFDIDTLSDLCEKDIQTNTNDDEKDIHSKDENLNEEENDKTNYYIGNSVSKKFHKPTCTGLPDDKNRVYFNTREDALASEYEPCKKCNP